MHDGVDPGQRRLQRGVILEVGEDVAMLAWRARAPPNRVPGIGERWNQTGTYPPGRTGDQDDRHGSRLGAQAECLGRRIAGRHPVDHGVVAAQHPTT